MNREKMRSMIEEIVEEHFEGFGETGVGGYTVRNNPRVITIKARNPENVVYALRDAGITAGIGDKAFDEVEVAMKCADELDDWIEDHKDYYYM